MPIIGLNATRAMQVATDNTINIPNIGNLYFSGMTTGTSVSNLVMATGDFVNKGVKVGDIVYNTTDFTCAIVTGVTNATTLALSADIMTSGETFRLFQASQNSGLDNPGCFLQVSNTAGTGMVPVRVLTAGGDDVTLNITPNGSIIYLQVVRVFTATTSLGAGGKIHAIW